MAMFHLFLAVLSLVPRSFRVGSEHNRPRVRLGFPRAIRRPFTMLPRVKLISWNVNGLRSVLRKGFLDYLDRERPHIVCLQETRCEPDEVEQLCGPRH